jgi:hypothetical protein
LHVFGQASVPLAPDEPPPELPPELAPELDAPPLVDEDELASGSLPTHETVTTTAVAKNAAKAPTTKGRIVEG